MRRLKLIISKVGGDSWIRTLVELQGIDRRERYVKVKKIISNYNSNLESMQILDVGAGRNSALKQIKSNVISLDVETKASIDVMASITHLPFQDDTFDFITALDVLEHLKKKEREIAIREIKRCGKKIIIHSPLRGKNFKGRGGDLMFYNYIKKDTSETDFHKNTLQHLTCVEPSLRSLEKEGLMLVEPDFNVNVWLTSMKTAYKFHNLANPILVLFYLLILRRITHPPYWGGYLLFDSESPDHRKQKLRSGVTCFE
jgi:hypothetical protein